MMKFKRRKINSKLTKPNYLFNLGGLHCFQFDEVLYEKLNKIILKKSNPKSQIKEMLHDAVHVGFKNAVIFSQQFTDQEVEKLSVLWLAILGSWYDSVALLVQSKLVDLNEPYGLPASTFRQDLDKESSILHALLLMYPSVENERLIRLVIDLGGNVAAVDSRGRSLLHLAVKRRDRIQLSEMLLAKGVPIDAVDCTGETALLAASGTLDSDEMVRLLIARGANVTVRDNFGRNILHGRMRRAPVDDLELARVLIEQGVSLSDREYFTPDHQPLHTAILRGNIELVHFFLANGADVNAVGGDTTPLFMAAEVLEPGIMQILLDYGANVNQKCREDSTATHEICRHCDDTCLRLLLPFHPDIFIEDRQGKTPISILLDEGRIGSNCMKMLVKVLALKKAGLQPNIVLKHETLIKPYSRLWNFYRLCAAEVKRTKSRRFLEKCTFFRLLTNCKCQISELMRNQDFEKNFVSYDLNVFCLYHEDIIDAFERARTRYHAVLEIETVINEAHYGMLPYFIVRKIVAFAFIQDCYCSYRPRAYA